MFYVANQRHGTHAKDTDAHCGDDDHRDGDEKCQFEERGVITALARTWALYSKRKRAGTLEFENIAKTQFKHSVSSTVDTLGEVLVQGNIGIEDKYGVQAE